MLIEKHKSVAGLARAVTLMPEWRWLSALPIDLVQTLLGPIAVVAEWIAMQRKDLLSKDELSIAVVGSPFDSFESGALWSTLAAVLDKQPGWVRGSIQVNGGKPIGSLGRRPIAPECVASSIGVARVQEDVAGVVKILSAKTDLLVSTVGSPGVPASILCSGRPEIDRFVKRGGAVVSLAQCEQDALVMNAAGSALLMSHGMTKSKFPEAENESGLGWVSWQSGLWTLPSSGERLTSFAEFTAELIEALETMRNPLAEVFSNAVEEDPTSWGGEGLLQSSLDARDTFIMLPRSIALRRRTLTIVRLERGLAVDEMMMRVDEPTLSAYDQLGESWLEKAGWAATLWNSGLGKAIDSTLMGRMQKMGMDISSSALDKSIKEMLQNSGLDDQMINSVSNAMTGGERYAPERNERLVYDLVKRGETDKAWAMVRAERRLANALNERREPLLLQVISNGSKRDVSDLIHLGANPNGCDGGGRSVLTIAAGVSTAALVAALIELGADVNACDPLRWTPLLVALKRGNWEVAGLLVDRGADVTWKGADGLSALSFAQGERSPIDEVGKVKEMLANLPEEMRLPDLADTLKRRGLLVDASDVPDWLLKKMAAAA